MDERWNGNSIYDPENQDQNPAQPENTDQAEHMSRTEHMDQTGNRKQTENLNETGNLDEAGNMNGIGNTESTGLYSYSFVKRDADPEAPRTGENDMGRPPVRDDGMGGPRMRDDGMGGPRMRDDGMGGPRMRDDGMGRPPVRDDNVGGAHMRNDSVRRSYIPEEPKRRQKKHGFGVKLVRGVVIAVVFGLVAGGIFYGTNTVLSNVTGGTNTAEGTVQESSGSSSTSSVQGTAVSTATTVTDVSDVVSNVMPAMVAITNMSEVEYRNMFGQLETYNSEGCGSGIIVAEDDDCLYIATNNHVVTGATTLSVSFVDDQVVSAETKGTDESTDLAVVSVKKSDIPDETMDAIKIAVLGDSTQLQLGESAIAIGNALGYGQSVTTGVISALDREVTVTDSTTGVTITSSLIQTSAAINPGNSGGALLNMNGEVVGINSVKYSDTDVEGIGYAIPISTAQPIIQELITREEVPESESAYLGVAVVDVTSEVSASYDMPEGLYVAQVVENSAADQAGLMKGDIITAMDGHELSSNEELQELMKYYAAGTEVEIVIQRATNGEYQEMTITVTLGSKSS